MILNRKLLLVLSGIALGSDFVYLIARHALTASPAGADAVHTILLLIGFSALGGYITRVQSKAEQSPVQLIGKAVISAAALVISIGLIRMSSVTNFVPSDQNLLPDGVATLIVSAITGMAAGGMALLLFSIFSELIFLKRRRATRRNYIALLSLLALYVILYTMLWLQGRPHGVALVPIAILLVPVMIVNAFRFSWILVLTRKEKLVNLLLCFFGAIFFILLAVDSAVFTGWPNADDTYKSLLNAYHPSVDALFSLMALFGALYMGTGFTSTLLHLPTAKEFDRKKAEISSLQNMSRLVTEVFDLGDLLSTTTHLAMEITEGDGAWIELLSRPTSTADPEGEAAARGSFPVRTSLRSITDEQLASWQVSGGGALSSLVRESGKPVIIQDMQRDRRLLFPSVSSQSGSLAVLPLQSHGGLAGVLGVHKRRPYEFDKDVMHVLAAFADLVSIALENSRLIAESLTRERFKQEMQVARLMQHSLLPSLLPISSTYDIAAESLPAYEVGGDYFDAMRLDDRHLGITIGDVSGKGVSAALYMAQVKGIFQSVSGEGTSTRELLSRMNATLCKTLDRRSFISLLYAVLDIETGHLRFSRAGHCPLLYISGASSRFLRPDGMGLGLDHSEKFAASIEEEEIALRNGDLIILFTDGVTEARNEDGEEFQYERLAHVAETHAGKAPQELIRAIMRSVQEFTRESEALDDMTLLVLKWNGPDADSNEAQEILLHQEERHHE